jgi:hypothetical protein
MGIVKYIKGHFRDLNSHRVYQVLSRYTQLGKKPASMIPRTTLSAAIWSQLFTNPMPIMTDPQRTVMTERWILGPILRIMTVDGGWKQT